MHTSNGRQRLSGLLRRFRYGATARRVVGTAILMSGAMIFAADLATAAAVHSRPPLASK